MACRWQLVLKLPYCAPWKIIHFPKHVRAVYLLFMYIFNTVHLVGAIKWRHKSLTCSQQSVIFRHPEPSEFILRHLTLKLYIHFNITLPLKPMPPKWSLPSGFLTKTFYVASLNKCHSRRSIHQPSFDHPKSIRRGKQITYFLIVAFSPVSFCFHPLAEVSSCTVSSLIQSVYKKFSFAM